MSHKTKIAVNLVVVVLLGVVMVGWVLTELIGPGLVDRPFSVTADFADTGGVFTDQEVTYRGVLIGKVGDLSLTDDGVAIQLLIEPQWDDRIPADLVATINSKSAVGEQYVNLLPRSSAGPFLSDGSRIERSDTRQPVNIQALFDSLENVLADVDPEATGRVISELSDAVGGREGDIATILESLGRLADAFASVAPEQQRLLGSATRTGSAFLSSKEAFLEAIRAADAVLAGIGDEPDELANLFAANDRLARAGIELLAARGDELAGGIRALADFTDYQLTHETDVIQTLDYLPAFLHAIEDSSVPWRAPDGSRFYRIRVGLIVDNVRRSWPCKYKLPEDYERLPHIRTERDPITDLKCLPAGSQEEELLVRSLVTTMRKWGRENPAGLQDLLGAQPDTAAHPASDEGLIWPLDGPVTSYFGDRWGNAHTGIDIDGTTGDPVVAAATGTVVVAGPYYDYGDAVLIDHGGDLVTLYGHLSALAVSVGDRVSRGDPIGAVGCSGTCTGDHLHFEVRVYGTPVDPLAYLPGGALYGGVAGGGRPQETTGNSDSQTREPTPSPSPTS